MVVSKLSMTYEEKTIHELHQMRTNFFWSNKVLKERNKRIFAYTINAVSFLHLILWCLATVMVILANKEANIYLELVYNENWPYFYKTVHKTITFIFIVFGFFTGTAHECYYAYNILHGYFQMDILMAYLNQEMEKYENMTLKDKVLSELYQSETRKILRRCISHYQKLKMLYTHPVTILFVQISF